MGWAAKAKSRKKRHPTKNESINKRKNEMKKHRGLKITAGVLITAILFFIVINIIPPKKSLEENPFIVNDGGLPMIAAHRGGGECNPENTMLAFREAVTTYGVDIIESDLYLTKDGALVYNHDSYIDRTCNVNGDIPYSEVVELIEDKENRHYIKDMTLAELKRYNFGYYFESDGERMYKDVEDIKETGLQIATVDELFSEFYRTNPDLLFIVEIKNDGERGREACKILSDTLDDYPAYRGRVVVGTFHDEIEKELKTNYPDLYRGASTGTATSFIITTALGVNTFDTGDFACLQIPTEYEIMGITVELDKTLYINRAHRRNIAVQYRTINYEETMRRLIELGCDCIMTDNPKLLSEVLNTYEK